MRVLSVSQLLRTCLTNLYNGSEQSTHSSDRPPRLHRQIVQAGQKWGLHVIETPLAWLIHAVYVGVTVGWGMAATGPGTPLTCWPLCGSPASMPYSAYWPATYFSGPWPAGWPPCPC